LLRPHWKALSVAFVAVLVEGGADLLEPWPLKVVFDYVIGSKPMPQWLTTLINHWLWPDMFGALEFAVISIIIIATVGALASYTEKYLTTTVGQHVMHDLRHTLYHHIQRLSLPYFDRQRTGDLTVRVTGDIDAVQNFVSSALLGIVVDVLTLAGMIVIMLYLNWRFTLVSISVAPFLFLVVYRLTRRIKGAARQVRKKEGEIASTVQESLSSMRVVKAFGREDYEERRLDQESLESVELALHARAIKGKLSPAVDLLVAAGTCLVLWFGARLVMSGEITPGALLVFVAYLGKMYKPMRDLSKMADTLSKSSVGLERIGEVLKTERQVRDLPGARAAPSFRGRIEFDHVAFGYRPDKPILRDVNFAIEPGQFAALVGLTGGGKTTILSLIPRLYDVVSGSVKIDGQDVRNYTVKSLRQQVSMVLQETILFHAPVWQNIAYGRPDATREEIIRAARMANADEFIEKMSRGYDTMIGERGETLSGGQRQRIAIARAIIRDSPIILLDEASSELDAASEAVVFEALKRMMQGKTSIVTAHRLSTVRRADIIFVLDEGVIIESGTHVELLARGGLYSRLYRLQFQPQEAAACY
jgi:subfamily B ATP-binding cassette protein MsbA